MLKPFKKGHKMLPQSINFLKENAQHSRESESYFLQNWPQSSLLCQVPSEKFIMNEIITQWKIFNNSTDIWSRRCNELITKHFTLTEDHQNRCKFLIHNYIKSPRKKKKFPRLQRTQKCGKFFVVSFFIRKR